MTAIPPDEVAFHPHSFADDSGRLFWWRDRLFRAIAPEQAQFYRELVARPEFVGLVGSGRLAGARLAEHTLAGSGLVLEHDVVPFPSYATEWPGPMLRDAALFLLDLARDLDKLGLELKDAHPWNVLFRATAPTYVDLGSIVPRSNTPGWRAESEFRRFFLNPLTLIASGAAHVARALLPEYDGVTTRDVARYAPLRLTARRMRALRSRREHGLPQRLSLLRREVEAIDGQLSTGPMEADVGAELLSLLAQRTDAQTAVLVEPAALPATSAVETVVVLAADEHDSAALYAAARSGNAHVLPLLMDVCDPTPQRGIAGHWQLGAVDRLRCDVVVVSPRAVRDAARRSIRPEILVTGLVAFARHGVAIAPDTPEQLEPLTRALRTHFAHVEEVDTVDRRVVAAT
jgi:hypothetical protein